MSWGWMWGVEVEIGAELAALVLASTSEKAIRIGIDNAAVVIKATKLIELAKRAILFAWLKDPGFGERFFEVTSMLDTHRSAKRPCLSCICQIN